MGKILSFTVLCIINFAVCRRAIELDRGSYIPVERFPGLINGDDCCFPIRCFEHWVGCSAMVGLYNSIGKTFTSRSFVEMNSRTFLVNFGSVDGYGHAHELSFVEVPFINFGLLKGLVRSDGGEITSNPNRDLVEACGRMGWCHRTLITGFEFAFDELDFLFKKYHNKYLLNKNLCGLPYYMPFWLGGLGLYPGWKPEELISENHLKCAKYIYQEFIKEIRSVALNKTCLIDSMIEKYFDDIMFKYSLAEIPNFDKLQTQEGDNVDLEYENQLAYNQHVEYIWRSMRLEEFFVEMDDDFVNISYKKGIKTLFNNTKIWKRAYATVANKKYKQIKWYSLWQKKQNSRKPIIVRDASYTNRDWVRAVLS